MGIDWSQLTAVVLGGSLVLVLPMDLLDGWMNWRYPHCTFEIFPSGWAAFWLEQPTPRLGNPFAGKMLQLVALRLLQTARQLRPSPGACKI